MNTSSYRQGGLRSVYKKIFYINYSGGIYNEGVLTITNSVISNNHADMTLGGSIVNWSANSVSGDIGAYEAQEGEVDDLPMIEIVSPVEEELVAGSVMVTAFASGDNYVTQFEFFLGGVSLTVDSDESDGWEVTWDTTEAENGRHTIEAEAADTIGQVSPLASVYVNVDTPTVPSTIHVADLDGPSSSSAGNTWPSPGNYYSAGRKSKPGSQCDNNWSLSYRHWRYFFHI